MRMICLCFGRNQDKKKIDIKGRSVLNVAKVNWHFKSNVRLYVSSKVFPKVQPFNREQQVLTKGLELNQGRKKLKLAQGKR